VQATLRMRGDAAVSANAVEASLGSAAQYLITASKTATVVALTRPVSQVGNLLRLYFFSLSKWGWGGRQGCESIVFGGSWVVPHAYWQLQFSGREESHSG